MINAVTKEVAYNAADIVEQIIASANTREEIRLSVQFNNSMRRMRVSGRYLLNSGCFVCRQILCQSESISAIELIDMKNTMKSGINKKNVRMCYLFKKY